jgi:hypothetical protein
MEVFDAVVNLNTLLILLGTGVVIWIVRLFIPDAIENTKMWKVVLKILPIIIGALIAFIPGLRPTEVPAQCAVIGAISGSLSANVYGVIREAMGEKIKALVGSPQDRKRASQVPSEPPVDLG